VQTVKSWQAINELLNRKSKTTTINEINMNGKTIVGDEEIAKEFNKYFSEVSNQRKQVCKINNAVSDAVEIHCGVTQGSNLGPLLFNSQNKYQ
jgi:hypothetical protein